MQTTALHPVDELAAVRRQKKALETREGELRKLLIGDREARVGRECIAVVTDRASSTVDWKGLALSLGATPDQIAARTTSKVTTYVETEKAPSLPEVLRVLTTERLVVLDTETTGLSPAKGDRIVSVGILPVRLEHPEGGSYARPLEVHEGNAYSAVVNPGRPSSAKAREVHGLDDAYLATCQPFSAIAREVWALLDGAFVVAHNAPFDVGFLQAEFAAAGLDLPTMYVVDTRIVSKLLWPEDDAKLDDLAECLNVDRGNRDERHDALEDCRLLARCLPGLVAEIARRI